MAAENSLLVRHTINKVGYPNIGSGDVSVTLDSADPDAVIHTQDLTADTVEALDLTDVGLPCAKILLKMIIPASGGSIEVSLQSGGSFDANRFAVMSKQNDFACWTPKLSSTIYVKSIGAAGRIMIVAG